MRLTEIAGLAGGLAGAGLFLAGVLVALLASLRLALTFRRPPERTRFARGIAAGAAVTAALGAALFWGAELLPQRRGLDRAALWISAAAVLAGIAAGVRVARKHRTPPRPVPEDAATPPAG
jgi:hypothetical protein